MEINTQKYLPFDVYSLGADKAKAATNPGATKSLEKAREAAEDFEAFFLSKMSETMFEGISTDGMFGGGNAEKIYRSLLINEYGKSMAKTGTIGVSDTVMQSILQMQEAASQGDDVISMQEVS